MTWSSQTRLAQSRGPLANLRPLRFPFARSQRKPARLSPGPPTTKLRRVVSHPSPFLSAQAFERPPNALFIPFRALWPDRRRQFPPLSLAGGLPTLSLTASLLLLSDRQSPPLPTRAHQPSTSLLEAHFIVCHLFAFAHPITRSHLALFDSSHSSNRRVHSSPSYRKFPSKPPSAGSTSAKLETKIINIRSQHGFNSATAQQYGCCQSEYPWQS